jgi:hypothetical protein
VLINIFKFSCLVIAIDGTTLRGRHSVCGPKRLTGPFCSSFHLPNRHSLGRDSRAMYWPTKSGLECRELVRHAWLIVCRDGAVRGRPERNVACVWKRLDQAQGRSVE